MRSRPIGKEISMRRRLLKITQNDLAEISGISLRTIKTIEMNKGNPTLGVISKILEPLGLTLTTEERIKHE